MCFLSLCLCRFISPMGKTLYFRVCFFSLRACVFVCSVIVVCSPNDLFHCQTWALWYHRNVHSFVAATNEQTQPTDQAKRSVRNLRSHPGPAVGVSTHTHQEQNTTTQKKPSHCVMHTQWTNAIQSFSGDCSISARSPQEDAVENLALMMCDVFIILRVPQKGEVMVFCVCMPLLVIR